MSTFKLCCDSPIPELQSMKDDIKRQLQDLAETTPNFSDLIDLLVSKVKVPVDVFLQVREQVYIGYRSIVEEINEIVDALKQLQDMITQFNIIVPLAKVLGGAIDELIPSIPVLNIKFTDLVGLNSSALYEAVAKAIEQEIELPFIPKQLYEHFTNNAKELVVKVKMILTGYKDLVIKSIKDVAEKVLSILEISATLPTLLTPPTIEELKTILKVLLPDLSWMQILQNYSVDDLLEMLSSALPFSLPSFSKPYLNFFSNIEEELIARFNEIVDFVQSLNLKTLVDFVLDNLSMLGFSFPTICIEF